MNCPNDWVMLNWSEQVLLFKECKPHKRWLFSRFYLSVGKPLNSYYLSNYINIFERFHVTPMLNIKRIFSVYHHSSKAAIKNFSLTIVLLVSLKKSNGMIWGIVGIVFYWLWTCSSNSRIFSSIFHQFPLKLKEDT